MSGIEENRQPQYYVSESRNISLPSSATSQDQYPTTRMGEENVSTAYRCDDSNFKTNQLNKVKGNQHLGFAISQ